MKREMIIKLLIIAACVLVIVVAANVQVAEQVSLPPPMTWTREFPKPLGNLPEGRILSCRNTERYECGLLCGYSYDSKGAVSSVVCVPYWFQK